MTNKKQSSEEMSSTAGRIMAMAREGGPLVRFSEELADATDPVKCVSLSVAARMTKIEKVLKPYIDEAESLAASVLAQSR
jgi:hypothetical protein